MKKLAIFIIIALFAVAPSIAFADWEVTVSGWTMSPGPDLVKEAVLMDSVIQCDNILPADSKSCMFNIPTKSNQEIIIRSFDSASNYADNIVGNIDAGPNPSSGGTITIIWK